jgi:hypothetical protein
MVVKRAHHTPADTMLHRAISPVLMPSESENSTATTLRASRVPPPR